MLEFKRNNQYKYSLFYNNKQQTDYLYDEVYFYEDNTKYYLVSRNGSYAILNAKFEYVTPFSFRSVNTKLNSTFILLQTHNYEWVVYDTEGKYILNTGVKNIRNINSFSKSYIVIGNVKYNLRQIVKKTVFKKESLPINSFKQKKKLNNSVNNTIDNLPIIEDILC